MVDFDDDDDDEEEEEEWVLLVDIKINTRTP